MTFTTPYVSVFGIPSAIPTRFEYTNAAMASAYFNSILAFVNVLQIQAPTYPFPAQTVSAQNVNQVNAALFQLTKLAKYGVIVTPAGQVFFPSSVVSAGFLAAHNLSSRVPPSAGKSSYQLYTMTMTMAQDYDVILRSLASVGVNVNASGANFPSVTLPQLQQWRDLAIQVSAISRVVQAAELEGFGGARSLQGIIEIDYVQTGNEIITRNLAKLQSALSVTQDVLNTLSQLQVLKNKITTQSSAFKDVFGQPFNYQENYGNQSPSSWGGFYQQYASAYFNRPVTPIILPGMAPGQPNFTSAFRQLVFLRTQLTSELQRLSSVSPASTITNPQSLYGTLKAVIADINDNFKTPTGDPVFSATPSNLASAGFKRWMLDNYSAFNSPNANKAGQIQQNLTFAITAGESLNDTQKETTRNFMYIFEEYYKSASAALQAITQIIQKIAQNISR